VCYRLFVCCTFLLGRSKGLVDTEIFVNCKLAPTGDQLGAAAARARKEAFSGGLP
jgi:hypothetical protein